MLLRHNFRDFRKFEIIPAATPLFRNIAIGNYLLYSKMLEKKATTTEHAAELVVDGCLILLVMKLVLALLLTRKRRVSTKSHLPQEQLALSKSELF